MNQDTHDFTEKEDINSPSSNNNENYHENGMSKKINLLSSEQINHFLKKLSSPGFLGSIHLKERNTQNPSLINNIISKNLEYKLSKSLKSPFNNPITRYLVLLMILFNILWILFIYVL